MAADQWPPMPYVAMFPLSFLNPVAVRSSELSSMARSTGGIAPQSVLPSSHHCGWTAARSAGAANVRTDAPETFQEFGKTGKVRMPLKNIMKFHAFEAFAILSAGRCTPSAVNRKSKR